MRKFQFSNSVLFSFSLVSFSLVFSLVPVLVLFASTALAAPVHWVDWTSGSAGASGSATGVLNVGSTIDVNYTGEIAFLQTNGGTNFWNPTGPYVSATVDNAPGTSDIIALSQASSKTITFSEGIQDLFFAIVSLNGNGYRFNSDFEIVSMGAGYWGNGTLSKQDLGGGIFQLNGSGEPHGVIRFTGVVTSITWTSLTNENWNGFTVGTFGKAVDPDPNPVPEPVTALLLATGAATLVARRKRA